MVTYMQDAFLQWCHKSCGSNQSLSGWIWDPLPETQPIPSIVWAAKNLRLDHQGTKGNTNSTLLLKEPSNKWLQTTFCHSYTAQSYSAILREAPSSSIWEQIHRPTAGQNPEWETLERPGSNGLLPSIPSPWWSKNPGGEEAVIL